MLTLIVCAYCLTYAPCLLVSVQNGSEKIKTFLYNVGLCIKPFSSLLLVERGKVKIGCTAHFDD